MKLSASTGAADWQCRLLPGISFQAEAMGGLTGARTVLDGREYPWDR